MSQYCNVTRQEMEGFLLPQGFEPIRRPGTIELLYAKRMDWQNGRKVKSLPAVSLIVFTGINPDGNSRKVGRDAIRVEVAYQDDEPVFDELRWEWIYPIHRVGGSKKVLRVLGWRENLGNRIAGWEQLLGPACPLCGAPTKEVNPKPNQTWKPFLSCARYRTTGCQGTLQIRKHASTS